MKVSLICFYFKLDLASNIFLIKCCRMTLWKIFPKSAKEEGEGVQKRAEKIRYLRRDAFVVITSFNVVITYFRRRRRKLTKKGGKNIFMKYISAQKYTRYFNASRVSNKYDMI